MYQDHNCALPPFEMPTHLDIGSVRVYGTAEAIASLTMHNRNRIKYLSRGNHGQRRELGEVFADARLVGRHMPPANHPNRATRRKSLNASR